MSGHLFSWPGRTLTLSRGRGDGGDAQLGLAGKEGWGGGWVAGQASPVSKRWKGSPHPERTPSSLAVAGSEVSPRPGSF